MGQWLMKTEPTTYSFSQLLKDKRTNWNGVRNFQARNFLKSVSVGDEVLIYHSGDEKSVVGIARVAKGPYPDPDPKKPGDWVQIDLEPKSEFRVPVALSALKAAKDLKGLMLLKQSRLSVMPVSAKEFAAIAKLGKV
jgi:predicted RNA-binding protein with PUA-like domain